MHRNTTTTTIKVLHFTLAIVATISIIIDETLYLICNICHMLQVIEGNYSIMTTYTVEQWQRDRELMATPGQEIAPEIYTKLLNALPPRKLPAEAYTSTSRTIREGFLMGEPYDHTADGQARYMAFGRNTRHCYYLGLFPEGSTTPRETYRKMAARHQNEVNALPLGFAFSKEQYREKLASWNITEEEAEAGAVLGIGHGGFCRASDRDLVVDTFKRIREEKRAAIESDTTGDGYVYQGLQYELINHEYSYTGDATDAILAVGLTETDLQRDAVQAALKRATREVMGTDPFDE